MGVTEPSKEKIKQIYIEILDPLGTKQFTKLPNLNKSTILNNINNLEQNNIITSKESQSFKNKISSLFGD